MRNVENDEVAIQETLERERRHLYSNLKTRYNLNLDIPLNVLSPRINNRVAYLEWALNLDTASKVVDIGTGYSCIYPLLGSVLFPASSWIGIDISQQVIDQATENIKINNLQDRISVHLNTSEKLFPSTIFNQEISLVICNPPFYESRTDINSKRSLKRKNPFGICTGRDHELMTEGGEYGFAIRMFNESRNFKHVNWFTCYFGIKKSAVDFKKALKSDLVLFREHSFQIGRTVRWIVAWRFQKE